MCNGLDSSCIHMDSAMCAAYTPTPPLPCNQWCTPSGVNAGENAVAADGNGVSCTVTLTGALPAGCTAPLYSITTENGVYFSYIPCNNWMGTVAASCRSFRQGTDWTNGVDPATHPTVDTFSFTANVVAVPCNTTICKGLCEYVRAARTLEPDARQRAGSLAQHTH